MHSVVGLACWRVLKARKLRTTFTPEISCACSDTCQNTARRYCRSTASVRSLFFCWHAPCITRRVRPGAVAHPPLPPHRARARLGIYDSQLGRTVRAQRAPAGAGRPRQRAVPFSPGDFPCRDQAPHGRDRHGRHPGAGDHFGRVAERDGGRVQDRHRRLHSDQHHHRLELPLRFPWLAKLLEPAPLLLIDNGRILKRNLRVEFISEDELRSKIREHGVDDPAKVAKAYIEPDGEVTVIKK